MSEMRTDLSVMAAELKTCAEVILSIAEDMLAKTTPTTTPTITLETVRAVLAEKSRNGYTDAVRQLLESHGAVKLSEIDPAKYPQLLKEVEVIGNG